MKLELKKLSEIKPYWRNARKNERAIEAVIDSIKEYGYSAPIVVDKKGVIIAGHTRFKALSRLEYTEAHVVVSDMDEARAKEYRIIDNKTSELATWDQELLIPELREFRDLSKFSLHFPDLQLPSFTEENSQASVAPAVSQEDFDKASDKLSDRFAEASRMFEASSKLITCPYCDESFEASYS